jgi:hypothetical protein
MSTGDPNPLLDAGPFGPVFIQDTIIDCTLIEVDGAAKPEDWNIQKGTKSKGSTPSWKGTKSAETLKLKFRTDTRSESYQAMTDMLLLVRPKLGDKPPSLHIQNAVINWGGIGVIALKQPAFPKWDAKTGSWEFEWEFLENDPSKDANVGPADPAKPDASDPAPKQSAADREIAALNKEIAALP